MTVADPIVNTPDDVLRHADEGRFELVNGQLVEKGMSKLSNAVASKVATKIGVYLDGRPIAVAYNEQPFMCFAATGDATRVRKPDVAVVLNEHVAADAGDESFFRTRPDIAIEVLSPNDRQADITGKLRDYAAARVPLVWLIEPELREVEVRRLGAAPQLLGESDTLTAEPILPGFSVKVGDLFPPEPSASSPAV